MLYDTWHCPAGILYHWISSNAYTAYINHELDNYMSLTCVHWRKNVQVHYTGLIVAPACYCFLLIRLILSARFVSLVKIGFRSCYRFDLHNYNWIIYNLYCSVALNHLRQFAPETGLIKLFFCYYSATSLTYFLITMGLILTIGSITACNTNDTIKKWLTSLIQQRWLVHSYGSIEILPCTLYTLWKTQLKRNEWQRVKINALVTQTTSIYFK